MIPELIGYPDRLSVAPGEKIRFMVSTDKASYQAAIVRLIHVDENPQGPGFKEEVIEASVNGEHQGRKQVAYSGSYVQVEHHTALRELNGFTIQAWIYSTTPMKGEAQGLITKWSQADRTGYGLVIGESGDLGLQLGNEFVHTGKPLQTQRWYFVAATYDPGEQKVCLYQLPVVERSHDESVAIIEASVKNQPAVSNESALLMAAAYAETVSPGRMAGRGLYNGKIDSPCLFSRALSRPEIDVLAKDTAPETIGGNALVAAWNFGTDFDSDKVTDTGPHGLNGVTINMPMRAVTGHNWTSTEFDFKYAPHQFGAIHFHDDDLDDAHWEADFEWTLPDQIKSGFYAARLRSGDLEDYIPFFVRPRKGTTSASIAYLVPTLTYLAYANERMPSFDAHAAAIKARKVVRDPIDLYLAEHPEFAASIYDVHSDGSGVCYSSRLRPITPMRPKYKFWILGSSRHYAADLYLVDWLENKHFDYDVITDEDLHHEGQSLLAHYKVIVTGTHPEYWTTPMMAALEDYLNHGGRVMYLGGNGFYWVTSIDPTRPHIVEVRRGTGGTRAWNSAPGEAFHSTTGEMGGLWRHRGKAPNQLVGIGFTAQGWEGQAGSYTRQLGSFDERAAFIFEGVGDDEVIGNFGLALGGAAGDELDRVDYNLGTPAHTLVLASSSGHDPLILPTIEDNTEISAAVILGKTDLVHADMVYFETPNNGAVFSTGSICWCGSLSHHNYDNNVSRITENVLRRFIS